MTQVEIVDDSGQVQVAPTEQTVTTVETDTPQPAVAIETPESGSGVEVISADTVDVEVQVPDGQPNILEATSASVVEVDVPAPSHVVLPTIEAPPVVEVKTEGPQGVKGDPGAPGATGPPGPAGAGASYVHYQNTAASVWSINHNLGFFPSVTIQDSAGTPVEGEPEYLDTDNVQVTFTAAFGGVAYLS